MKTNKLMTLALGALLAVGTLAHAQDEKKPEGKPPGEQAGGPGGPGGGQRGPRMSPEERFAKLATDLALTDDQKPKVKAIMEDTRTQMQGLKDLSQEDRRAKGKEIADAQKAKLKDVLTAEQFAKFEKLPMFGGGRGGRGGPGAPGGEGKAPKGDKAPPADKKE
jgi:Spy/CpxP family protein refolding chaperone